MTACACVPGTVPGTVLHCVCAALRSRPRHAGAARSLTRSTPGTVTARAKRGAHPGTIRAIRPAPADGPKSRRSPSPIGSSRPTPPTHVTPRSLVTTTTTTLEGIDRHHAKRRFSRQITRDPNGYAPRTNRDGRRAAFGVDDGDRTHDEQCFTKAQSPAIPKPPLPGTSADVSAIPRQASALRQAAPPPSLLSPERQQRHQHGQKVPQEGCRDLDHAAILAPFTSDDAKPDLERESARGRHRARASGLARRPEQPDPDGQYPEPPDQHPRVRREGVCGVERVEPERVADDESAAGNQHQARHALHPASLPAPRTPHDDGQRDRDQHRAGVEDEATDAPVVRQPDGSAPGQHKGDEDEQHAPTARGLPRVHPGSLPHRRAA
jgi:hypothetical protein